MYERSYGYKYDEAGKGWASAADIAKLMRADIKQAVSEGLLPAHATYSVRSESFSGGQAVDIEVLGWPEAWKDCDRIPCRNVWCKHGGEYRDNPSASVHQILTDEAEAAEMTLKRIHGAYNHDGSEIQVDYFDVRYYGQVRFEDARTAAFRAGEAAKKKARREAIDTAAKLETQRIKVYKRDGSSTVHLAVDIEGRIKLVCGAALWRSSLTGSTESEPTCSRCKKRA